MSKAVTSDVIKLKNVRLSFPDIWTAKAFQAGQEPKFQATFLLDPSDVDHAKQIKAIKVAAKKCIKERWDKKPAGLQLCFGLADEHEKKSQYDGYAGMFYVGTNNSQRPTLVDRRRQDLEQSDGVLYPGCYVNTNITFWTQDNQFGKRINGNLRIIQFVKDGEAFGQGPVKAAEEMDDVDDDVGGDDDWDDDDDL